MPCGIYWKQVEEVERALGSLRRRGISINNPAMAKLTALRGTLLKKVGFKFPRTLSQIVKLIGLSPGTLTLWHDAESGFMTEARERPGGPPVYRYVSDDIAARIINKDRIHELEEELLVPDSYMGE